MGRLGVPLMVKTHVHVDHDALVPYVDVSAGGVYVHVEFHDLDALRNAALAMLAEADASANRRKASPILALACPSCHAQSGELCPDEAGGTCRARFDQYHRKEAMARA